MEVATTQKELIRQLHESEIILGTLPGRFEFDKDGTALVHFFAHLHDKPEDTAAYVKTLTDLKAHFNLNYYFNFLKHMDAHTTRSVYLIKADNDHLAGSIRYMHTQMVEISVWFEDIDDTTMIFMKTLRYCLLPNGTYLLFVICDSKYSIANILQTIKNRFYTITHFHDSEFICIDYIPERGTTISSMNDLNKARERQREKLSRLVVFRTAFISK
jgi:hypothetical protein